MLPKQYNNRSIALLAFVIIISAFTGYRIGLSNQSILMSLPLYSTNNNHYTTSTSSSTATLHKLTQIASTARSNSINESDSFNISRTLKSGPFGHDEKTFESAS